MFGSVGTHVDLAHRIRIRIVVKARSGSALKPMLIKNISCCCPFRIGSANLLKSDSKFHLFQMSRSGSCPFQLGNSVSRSSFFPPAVWIQICQNPDPQPCRKEKKYKKGYHGWALAYCISPELHAHESYCLCTHVVTHSGNLAAECSEK